MGTFTSPLRISGMDERETREGWGNGRNPVKRRLTGRRVLASMHKSS